MTFTYNEILEEMKKAYFEKCSRRVEDSSDLGARFHAVASELYALACYADFIVRQAFVQTADGEYLDSHAELRSITRKQKSKASGTLSFGLAEPTDAEVQIPEGSAVCVKNSPYIQFETTQSAVIAPGDYEVEVPAQAIAFGSEYNVPAMSAAVMVNPPSGVTYAHNNNPFCGGFDDENDDSLRKRIIGSYRIYQNGINASSAEAKILELDEITDCFVPPATEPNVLDVYVRTYSGSVSDELILQIKEAIGVTELCGTTVNVVSAKENPVTVKAFAVLPLSFDKNEIKERITSEITQAFKACKIGEALSLSKLSNQINSDGFENFVISSTSADLNVITPDAGCYLVLSRLEVYVDAE